MMLGFNEFMQLVTVSKVTGHETIQRGNCIVLVNMSVLSFKWACFYINFSTWVALQLVSLNMMKVQLRLKKTELAVLIM